MIPDVAALTLVMSLLVMLARFGSLAKALIMRLLGPNMIGALRGGRATARRPQALPASE